MDLKTLKEKMDQANYIYDDTLATVLFVALTLGRPLLIEGAAGVGKTEIAKVMAAALDRELVRLQCYEGLDESKALYEWNYQKQLLSIQVNREETDKDALTRFADRFPWLVLGAMAAVAAVYYTAVGMCMVYLLLGGDIAGELVRYKQRRAQRKRKTKQ